MPKEIHKPHPVMVRIPWSEWQEVKEAAKDYDSYSQYFMDCHRARRPLEDCPATEAIRRLQEICKELARQLKAQAGKLLPLGIVLYVF
jgi:3-methyladenine DNA glycosylase Tag